MRKIPVVVSFCLIFISFINSSIAQGSNAWTKDFTSAIIWQKVTSLGQLVASTSRGLIGIDPKTGEEIWLTTDALNAPESSFESITNSPFISVGTDNGKNFCIIDPDNGKMIFNAKSVGLEQVADKHFLYASGK
ncbi:MAG: hypothetical protein ACKOQ6_08340, partial [Bacteroidota bacterium]